MEQQNNRRHYFIDKEIQLSYILTLFVPLVLVSILFAILLSLSISDTAQETGTIIEHDITSAIRESQLQDSILSSPEMVRLVSNIRYAAQKEHTFTLTHPLYRLNLITFGLIVLLGSILLVIVAIHISHKFVGPVYHITNSCKRVAEGDYREVIFLRDGDKLDRLAENFNLMVSITRMRLSELATTKSEEERKKISDNLKI